VMSRGSLRRSGSLNRPAERRILIAQELGKVVSGNHPQSLERGLTSLSEQLIARAQMRQSNLHLWPSRPPGSDDRLPEEHAKKRNHNDPKDEALHVTSTGLFIVGGQPVGIAHAILLGRPPASQPHHTLIKIS
jgi:hypothetical protein